MFTNNANRESKNVIVKTAMATLALLFIVVLGPGLLNIGAGKALAHDGQENNDQRHGDRWDYKVYACAQTSQAALTACKNSASSDYWLGIGACDNLSNRQDKQDCLDEAQTSLEDDNAACNDQFQARQEVCGELGQKPYDPDISSKTFGDNSADIANTYFPLKEGSTYTYQSNGDPIQTIVVKVKDTTTIDGVKCRIVTDQVYEGEGTSGNLVEDTTDYYAQEKKGNVWYFGENTIAYIFEYDDNGDLLHPPTASTEGAWMAGVDEAKPGIIMLADPGNQIGKLYRQEFLLGTAEDFGQVIEMVDNLPALPSGVSLPVGVHGPYLHTQDSTPLEPDVIEDKYYAPDVGLVLTVEPEATELLINIE